MINHNSSVPMYIQMAHQLSEAIYQGEYKAGDKLPSEHSLCQQFGVSRITVRQALNLLVRQDLAFSVHGKGTFVKTPSFSHELNKIVSFSRVLQQRGVSGHTRIQSFEHDCMDGEARNRLGGTASNLNLIGYASRTPVVYYRSYFPPELGEKMWQAARQAEQTGAAFSTYDLYVRIGVGMFRVEQTLSAVNADDELERILELPPGKALIVLESLYYDSKGAPLEYKMGYYRSDTYTFHLQREI